MGSLREKLEYWRYRRLSKAAWHQMLLDSVDGKARLPMPGFPHPDLQAGFVGSSGRGRSRRRGTSTP